MNNNVGLPYLYKTLVPIDKHTHKNYCLSSTKNYSFARSANAVPIHLNEAPPVCSSYPIIFVGEERIPAAALGLTEGQNLFIDNQGNWNQNHHIPSHLQCYPFRLANIDGSQQKILCFDSKSELISKENLGFEFIEHGEFSSKLKQVLNECNSLDQSFMLTRKLIKQLSEFDLFCTKTVSYKTPNSNEEKIQFTAIDETKFDALNDEQFCLLRKSGAINIVYAHLFSLSNWQRLINRASK